MSIVCTVCESELEPGSVGALAVQLFDAVSDRWYSFNEGDKVPFAGGVAEVVKVRDGWSDSDGDIDYSYTRQGQTFEAYVVFKVGEYFFRKEGTGDSYGEVSWDGNYGPVQMKSKTVTVYEF
jgi:hypothetical protein